MLLKMLSKRLNLLCEVWVVVGYASLFSSHGFCRAIRQTTYRSKLKATEEFILIIDNLKPNKFWAISKAKLKLS